MGTLPKSTLGVFSLPGITITVTTAGSNKFRVRARPTEGGLVDVESTQGPQVGDWVKIAYTQHNPVIEDDEDSDAEVPDKVAYGLLCNVDGDDLEGVWIYEKAEMTTGVQRQLRAQHKRALTTDEFGPFKTSEVEVMDTEPPAMAAAVLNWATKRMDPPLSAKDYRNVIKTAAAIKAARSHDGRTRRRVDIFDMPGHAAAYQAAYKAGGAERQHEMTMCGEMLYCSKAQKWWQRLEEMHMLITRLDEASALMG